MNVLIKTNPYKGYLAMVGASFPFYNCKLSRLNEYQLQIKVYMSG